jgi:hypothetical protein
MHDQHKTPMSLPDRVEAHALAWFSALVHRTTKDARARPMSFTSLLGTDDTDRAIQARATAEAWRQAMEALSTNPRWRAQLRDAMRKDTRTWIRLQTMCPGGSEKVLDAWCQLVAERMMAGVPKCDADTSSILRNAWRAVYTAPSRLVATKHPTISSSTTAPTTTTTATTATTTTTSASDTHHGRGDTPFISPWCGEDGRVDEYWLTPASGQLTRGSDETSLSQARGAGGQLPSQLLDWRALKQPLESVPPLDPTHLRSSSAAPARATERASPLEEEQEVEKTEKEEPLTHSLPSVDMDVSF